jgi:PAS domain S-box-containing protein
MTKYRILIVEDDSFAANQVQKNLNRLGYVVVSVVSSGEKAVREAELLCPDLVLMDIILKGEMDGIEAADKIHALGIPVIFVTACSDNNTFDRAKHTGHYGYITKPMDLRLMHLNIDMALIRHKTEKALVERSRLAELGSDIGAALTKGFTIRESLQWCAEALVKHLDAAFARIWTLNSQDQTLYLQASSGLYTHINGFHSRIPLGAFKIGRIAAERRPHITNTVVGDPRIHEQEWAKKKGIVSFAGHPLIVNDRTVGVMAIFRRKPLSDTTMKALESVADIISLGIEHKQSVEAHIKSEEKYKNLVELTSDIIYIYDMDGNQVYLNDAGYQRLKYSPEEIIGEPWIKVVHPEDRDMSLLKIKEMTETGVDVFSFENRYLSKNSSEINMLHNVRMLRDERGEITGTQGIARDITLRKRAEENLKLFSKAIEEAMDGVQIVDLDGYIIYSNKTVEELYGYTSEELIGKHVNEMNVDKTFDWEPIIPIIREKGHWRGELRSYHKNGSEFLIWLSASIVTDDSGDPIAMIGIIRDITEFKKTEEELRNHREHLLELVENRTFELKTAIELLTQEINIRKTTEETLKESEAKFKRLSQEFHTLLDAISDSLLLLSPDLKVLWTNKAAAESFKKEISALEGRHCFELWHNNSEPCSDCHVVRCFNTGEPESSRRTTHNKRLLDSRAFPIKGDDNNVLNVIIIVTDITEKTNLEAEAVRAGHLASLGELAAGVAHEINNPINGIINYAQIIANKSEKRSKESDIASRIIKEGNRIAVIVSSLLSFARERKEEKAPVRIERILHDSITLTEVQIRKEGIILKIDLSSPLPEIIANPQQIQQVLLNIISNARYALNRKYQGTHESKKIEISCNKLLIDGSPFVRLIFYDQGTGISANILDKVLNPFFSTKPSGEGTGLGLSISHGIIKDHGGRLQIESKEAEFTRIIIDLPAIGSNGR